jgi:hypothetical protein
VPDRTSKVNPVPVFTCLEMKPIQQLGGLPSCVTSFTSETLSKQGEILEALFEAVGFFENQ